MTPSTVVTPVVTQIDANSTDAPPNDVLPTIVIAHSGDHRYFHECAAAARRFGRVHLIDFDVPDDDPQYRALCESYVHLSGRSVRYELTWCLRRYFLMRNLFRGNGIARGWLLDSDLLLVGELPDPALFPAGTICAMSMPPVDDELDRHFSPHGSYWTLEALESFCAFMVRIHRDDGDQLRALDRLRRSRGITSALGEMILLAKWSLAMPGVFNLFTFTQGGMMDHNLRSTEQPAGTHLKSRFGNKLIHRTTDGLFAETLDGRHIKLRSVHFQGGAKLLMPDFAHGRALSYALKAWGRQSTNRLRLLMRRLKRRALPIDRL